MYKVHHLARELAANLAMGVPRIRAARIRQGRTVNMPAEAKARHVLAQFRFFMDTIGADALAGKTVLEIGPGDAIPLAPLFLAAGARRYVALDRFLGDVTNMAALALYRATLHQAGLDVDLLRSLHDPDRVALVHAQIENEVPPSARDVDYIVSFNVCEHLANLPQALANMAALLAPCGRMIHRVDYGPHDVWQTYANPLAFLTVPSSVWALVSSHRGCPNRFRHAQLVQSARNLGLTVTDRIGRRIAGRFVREVRPRLAAEFRNLSDEELGVLDAEIVCGFGGPMSLGRPFLEH